MEKNLVPEYLLKKYYIDDKLSTHQIAKIFNCSSTTIYRYLIKYNIQIRNKSEAMTEEHLSKMIECSKQSKRIYKPMSDEQKQKISQANSGRIFKPSKYGGHIKKRVDGYVCVYVKNHPNSNKDGYVMEHILVMEEFLGRYLTPSEVVHHINHQRDDNRIQNLELMTKSSHSSFHMKERNDKGQIKHKTKIVKNIDTGEIFQSTKEAGKQYDVSATSIALACREQWRTVKKCKWKYVE